MVPTEAETAMCVQRFDDSRNSASHTTYRISLRSSSLREPRYPLLRVVSLARVAVSPPRPMLQTIGLPGSGVKKMGGSRRARPRLSGRGAGGP